MRSHQNCVSHFMPPWRGTIAEQPMRTAMVFVVIAYCFPGAAYAQAPPSNEVAWCRSMDSAAQWACFKALNEKMKQAVKPNSAVPAAPSPNPAAPAASSGMVAVPGAPACASLSNAQKRLLCYDAKFPPPPMPAPVSALTISN